jgi:hypothetical protein
VPGTEPATPLADWVAELEASTRGTRRRRIAAVGAVSAAVLLLSSVGIALATDERRTHHAPAVASASPSPPWTSGLPVVEVSPAAGPGGLTVSARSATDTVRPGEAFAVVVVWHDDDGGLLMLHRDWGDGSRATQSSADACERRPGEDGGTSTHRHAWTAPGTYRVRFVVTTLTCDGQTETGAVEFDVHVAVPPAAGPGPVPVDPPPAPPSPAPDPRRTPSAVATTAPAPTPSPTPPSPSATATPTGSPEPVPTTPTTVITTEPTGPDRPA